MAMNRRLIKCNADNHQIAMSQCHGLPQAAQMRRDSCVSHLSTHKPSSQIFRDFRSADNDSDVVRSLLHAVFGPMQQPCQTQAGTMDVIESETRISQHVADRGPGVVALVLHLCYTPFLQNQAIGLQMTPDATCCRIPATHFHPADRIPAVSPHRFSRIISRTPCVRFQSSRSHR